MFFNLYFREIKLKNELNMQIYTSYASKCKYMQMQSVFDYREPEAIFFKTKSL